MLFAAFEAHLVCLWKNIWLRTRVCFCVMKAQHSKGVLHDRRVKYHGSTYTSVLVGNAVL